MAARDETGGEGVPRPVGPTPRLGMSLAEFLSSPVSSLARATVASSAVPETAGKPDLTLRVIRDPAGKKLAEKLYETYIRRQDAGYDNFVEFLYNLDRMMSEHGGLAVQPDAESDDGHARVSGDADESDEDESDEEDGDEDFELAADALGGCVAV